METIDIAPKLDIREHGPVAINGEFISLDWVRYHYIPVLRTERYVGKIPLRLYPKCTLSGTGVSPNDTLSPNELSV